MKLVRCLAAISVVLLSACSGEVQPDDALASRPTPAVAEPATSSPTPSPSTWRKERYVPAGRALRQLQDRVDTRVMLPTDRPLGLPAFTRWLADPRYTQVRIQNGERVGEARLVWRRRQLNLSFGHATFDGCGGDTAIETNVHGQRALLLVSPTATWSQLIWPVRPGSLIGLYGLSGTFEGWELVKLARSMEVIDFRPPARPHSC